MPYIGYSKVGTALDKIIAYFFQEFIVSGVIIIFPNVSCQPGTCHRVKVPGHIFIGQRGSKSENVSGYGGCPSASAEIVLGSFISRLYQGTDEVYQWPYTFVQIGGASRPVVHLDIDIIMVIYMPWAIYPVGPHSLQVGREIAGA